MQGPYNFYHILAYNKYQEYTSRDGRQCNPQTLLEHFSTTECIRYRYRGNFDNILKIYTSKVSLDYDDEITLFIRDFLLYATYKKYDGSYDYIFNEKKIERFINGVKYFYFEYTCRDKSLNVMYVLQNVYFTYEDYQKVFIHGGSKKPKSTYKCTEKTIVYKKKERRIWVKDDKSYIKRMLTKNGKRQAIYTRV